MKIGVVLFWIAVMTIIQWNEPHLAAGDNTARNLRKARPSESLRNMISASASRQGVDPALVEAIIAVESAFNPLAISVKGAMGLMQLMPQTASHYGVTNPFDPKENVNGGVRYLRDLLLRFENLLHALAAYNAGEGAVIRYRGLPPYRETQEYVKKVLGQYRPGRRFVSSASVLSRGRLAGELTRIIEKAKDSLRERRVASEVNRAGSTGRISQVISTPRSITPRPLTQMFLGSTNRTWQPPRNLIELRANQRR